LGTSCVTRKAAIHPPKSPWSSIQRFSAAVRWPLSVVRKPKANSRRSCRLFPRVHRCDHDDKGGSKTAILLRYSIPPRSIMTSTDGRTKTRGTACPCVTYIPRKVHLHGMDVSGTGCKRSSGGARGVPGHRTACGFACVPPSHLNTPGPGPLWIKSGAHTSLALYPSLTVSSDVTQD